MKHTGGLFVGMMSPKIIAPGIVKYVIHVGIGGNGTVKSAISVPMGLPSLVSIAEYEDQWGRNPEFYYYTPWGKKTHPRSEWRTYRRQIMNFDKKLHHAIR